MNTLTIIIVIIVGVILGSYFGRRKKSLTSKNIPLTDSKQVPSVTSETTEVKEDNGGKILKFIQENQRITNNDVEKLLGVSDATATRYLDDLEKEEKISQIGDTGQGVYYILK